MDTFDPVDYHVDAIAEHMAQQHPDMKKMKEEMRAKVADAISCVKTGGRQNRSSAQKEPMPPIRVNSNPTGAKRGK